MMNHATGRGLIVAAVVALIAPRMASAQTQQMKPEVLERVKKSAVMVETYASQQSQSDTLLGSGSGYFINGTGLAVTNNHVVDPAHKAPPGERLRIQSQYGRITWKVVTDSGTDDEKVWKGEVIYQNESADQAIIQTFDDDGEKLQTPNFLRFLPEHRLKLRLPLWGVGFPGGDSQRTSGDKHPEVTIRTGFITDLPRTPAGRLRMIFTDVPANPGNSGGPEVTIDGFVAGTLTLGFAPQDGRGVQTGLVPAALSEQFVRAAFDLGRIPAGSDLKPFMSVLSNENGRIDLPEYRRLKERDVVFYPNGDIIHGKISTPELTWESAIGTFNVPMDSLAYVLSDAMGTELILEGGSRISAIDAGANFSFNPLGGDPTKHDFMEVKTLGFRTTERMLRPVRGEVVILDSKAAFLKMKEVRGKVKFDSVAGPISFDFTDIARIETAQDGSQIAELTDGRRLSGRFTEDPVEGIIAATGVPVKFHLANVEEALVETTYEGLTNLAGINLVNVMAGADRDIVKIARLLESDDPADVKRRIEALAEPAQFRNLPEVKKEQVRLLEAVMLLREGKYDDAKKGFISSGRASKRNVSAYARASLEVLKAHEDTQYKVNDEPLSDVLVFARAGKVIAEGYIQEVRDILKDENTDLETVRKADYYRALSAAKRYGPIMEVAGVLGGQDADDELIRLWNYYVNAGRRELYRLDQERRKIQEDAQAGPAVTLRGARGGGTANAGTERQLREIQEQWDSIIKTMREFAGKLEEAGFRIEDPDVTRQKIEGKEDEGP